MPVALRPLLFMMRMKLRKMRVKFIFVVCVCSSLPVLVWHRLNWSALFPLVHLDNTDELTQVTGGYIAGFNDSTVTMRSVAAAVIFTDFSG